MFQWNWRRIASIPAQSSAEQPLSVPGGGWWIWWGWVQGQFPTRRHSHPVANASPEPALPLTRSIKTGLNLRQLTQTLVSTSLQEFPRTDYTKNNKCCSIRNWLTLGLPQFGCGQTWQFNNPVPQISYKGKFKLCYSGFIWTWLEMWRLGLDPVPYTSETFCSLSIQQKSHPVQHKTDSRGENESSSAWKQMKTD